MNPPPIPTRPIVYPESDGKPMAESDTHREEMTAYAIEVLQDHFAGRPDAYVAGNNFLYWVEGDPSRCVSPDAYVVFGVEKGLRRVFKVWEERGAVPAYVLELTSRSTRLQDLGEKMAIYRDELQVPDYFIFDPLGECATERLKGYTLREGIYQPIAADPATGRLPSASLGLHVAIVQGHVRFFLPGAASPLPTRLERARTAEARAGAAEARASAAEAEVARLMAELDRVRKGGRSGEGHP